MNAAFAWIVSWIGDNPVVIAQWPVKRVSTRAGIIPAMSSPSRLVHQQQTEQPLQIPCAGLGSPWMAFNPFTAAPALSTKAGDLWSPLVQPIYYSTDSFRDAYKSLLCAVPRPLRGCMLPG